MSIACPQLHHEQAQAIPSSIIASSSSSSSSANISGHTIPNNSSSNNNNNNIVNEQLSQSHDDDSSSRRTVMNSMIDSMMVRKCFTSFHNARTSNSTHAYLGDERSIHGGMFMMPNKMTTAAAAHHHHSPPQHPMSSVPSSLSTAAAITTTPVFPLTGHMSQSLPFHRLPTIDPHPPSMLLPSTTGTANVNINVNNQHVQDQDDRSSNRSSSMSLTRTDKEDNVLVDLSPVLPPLASLAKVRSPKVWVLSSLFLELPKEVLAMKGQVQNPACALNCLESSYAFNCAGWIYMKQVHEPNAKVRLLSSIDVYPIICALYFLVAAALDRFISKCVD
jgi:hypothetical protein